MQIPDFDDELLFDDEVLLDENISLPTPELSNIQSPNFPILKFTNSEPSTFHKIILWPVYGWRIAAPQKKERKLDFLQLTSLRLANAGVTSYQEQAKKLGQHKDFLFNVMSQLKEDKYIDGNGRLTQNGEKILQKDGQDEEEETQYGWIFQDGTAGELLNWFHTEKLPTNNSKKGGIGQTFQLPWIFQTPIKPNANDIISAIKTQNRLLKLIANNELSGHENNLPINISNFAKIDEQDTFVNSNRVKELNQEISVRFLTKKPQKFYILVSCIIEGTHDGQFFLSCPFGLPDSFRWVRLLNFATSQSEEGKKIVEDLQSLSREVWKQELSKNGQTSEVDPVSLQKQSSQKVIFELGLLPEQKWSGVWRELEQMEQSSSLLQRGFSEVDTTITRSQRVLEQLILTILKFDTIPNNIYELYKARDALSQCLKDTVTACGGNEIPERIVSTKLGAIRNVIEGGTNSLRPYIATLILSASRRSSLHRIILENILRDYSDFLVDIEQIAHTRNNFGAHAGSDHHEPIILVEDVIKKVYKIVLSVLKAWKLTVN